MPSLAVGASLVGQALETFGAQRREDLILRLVASRTRSPLPSVAFEFGLGPDEGSLDLIVGSRC